VPILGELAQGPYRPIAVFCAPDKPVGRKQILTPPPVKIIAQKYNIPVWQPANSRELAQQLKTTGCHLIVCAAYRIILPREVLEMPKYGCLNIHPSLLPKYRGTSPIQAAILNGDDETGVTIFKMDKGIDTGPVIAYRKLPIANSKYTTPELSTKLSKLGAELLLETLPDWIAGKIISQPQDESQASYTKIIKKQDGLINWVKSAAKIERQIRAFTPWPGAYSQIANSKSPIAKTIKIIEADILEKNADKNIGEIFLTDSNELSIQAGEGALIIKKLQEEGGKPMSAQDFLRGHKEIIGQILK